MVVRVWWNAAWICRFECTRTVITHPTASRPSPETSGLDRARARVVVHGRSRGRSGAVLVRSAEPGGVTLPAERKRLENVVGHLERVGALYP